MPHLSWRFTSCTIAAVLILVTASFAKDDPVNLTDCPAAVQQVIQQYQSKATLEEVKLDEKKKSGGPAVYEAKFTLPEGRRIEVHISPNGAILKVEEKRRRS